MYFFQKCVCFINKVLFDIFLKLNNTESIKFLKLQKIIILKKKLKTNVKFLFKQSVFLKNRLYKAKQAFNELYKKELIDKAVNLINKNTKNEMLNKKKEIPHLYKSIENYQCDEYISIGCTKYSILLINDKKKILIEKDFGSLIHNNYEYKTPLQINKMIKIIYKNIKSNYYYENEDRIERNLAIDFLKNTKQILLNHKNKNQFDINNQYIKAEEKLKELNNEKIIEAIKNYDEFYNINKIYINNLIQQKIITDEKEIRILIKINFKNNTVYQKQQLNFYLEKND